MKLYLAGPMSGHPGHNFPAFHEGARKLRDLGYEVVSPAEMDFNADLTHPWEWYMKKDIALLCGCDGIAMLPGWQQSKGACLEHEIAQYLNMPVFHLPNSVPPCRQTNLFSGAGLGYGESGS
jgi:nucleoside 2-deoxyribosyltransferase